MRQLLLVLILIGAISACQTAPIGQFSKIRMGMPKEEVLEALGSPNRTEMIEGKDKWAYRYYTGENRDVQVLKQVTFFQGYVTSFGDDTDEIKRLQQIKDSDEKRASLYNSEKEAMKKRPAFVYPPKQE